MSAGQTELCVAQTFGIINFYKRCLQDGHEYVWKETYRWFTEFM